MANINPSQLPPQNLDAEKSLLGSILIDREAINRFVDFIKPEDFYGRAHQIIFEASLALFDKREPIDLLSLSNKLTEMGQLEPVGGVAYLTSLANAVATAAHAETYAKIVQRKKMLRDLIDAANRITTLGHDEEEDIEVLMDKAEQSIFAISQRSVQQAFTPITAALASTFERIDRLHKGDGMLRGVTTGFYDLDQMLSGLQKSDLVVLASRPSLGKTSLALDIGRHVAKKEKVPIGVFSLEMSQEAVLDRLIAAEAGVSLWKLRTGKLSHEGEANDFTKIAVAFDSLSAAPIFIDDSAAPNVLQMRAMARRLQAEHGLGLLIVDYLQLVRTQRSYDSPVQQVTEISRSLKALARELEVPVLAVSQLSRAVESRTDQRPKLSDLRDSGSIEQDADVVMFIYREDRVRHDSERKNIAEIIIAKHRNGPTGQIELYFDQDHTSFKNLAVNI